ncbi:MAG: radical SAM family heme chaperone HemW [Chloroflexota bacterium]
MQPHSIYLHIPFCRHRCGYCDFNTYAGQEALVPAYVQALCSEARLLGKGAARRIPVHTIFFGGGTPSLLLPEHLEAILGALHEHFDVHSQAEVSLEANPGTLSRHYLETLRRLGVNRLSLGMQSAHPGELRLLERQHNYTDVIQAATWARQAGFDNLNLDLIFGLPEQALETWQRSLELALGLHPEHLALYALTLEHGTPFGRWARRGLLSVPDPDLAAEMYEWASETLDKFGYAQYEISNWVAGSMHREASPALACRHNLQYWRNLPYLGLGAGAHGFAGGRRTANLLAPGVYIQRLQASGEELAASDPWPVTPATQSAQVIERAAEIAETMMMGLRLTLEGVSDRAFQARFGQSLEQVFVRQIERLLRLGLLEWAGEDKDILRLTSKGRLLGNQVFVEFI